MKFSRILLVSAVLLLAVMSRPLLMTAQETTGTIQGNVTDPSGAVVPGTSITLTDLSKLRTRSTTSGNDGAYRVEHLEPGRYSISFESRGFAKNVVPNVEVLVGKTIQVDAVLKVGTTSQEIVVTGAAVPIDVTSTMVAQNVPSEQFDLLPKPRNFDGVAIFSPSVNTGELEGGYQINGSSGAENNFYVDGVSTVSMLDGSLRQSAVFDYLAEVQVQTSGLEAQYGGALGGVVTAVTKSGGSRFHGDGHYYFYGNGLSAGPTQRLEVDPENKYTMNPTLAYIQDAKQSRNYQEFGGSLGGPLIKQKLFFFTSASPRWARYDYKYHFTDGPADMKRDALQMSWFSKLDLAPANRVRMNVSYLYTPERVTGSIFGYDGFAPNTSTSGIADAQASAKRGFRQPENSVAGDLEITLSPRALLSVKGGRYYLNYRTVGSPADHEYWWEGDSTGIPGIDPSAAHVAGYTTPSAANTYHDTTTRTYVQADFTKYFNFGGQHDLKAGIGTTKNVNNVENLDTGDLGRVYLYWGATNYRGVPAGQYGYYRVDYEGTSGSAGAEITNLYGEDSWRIHRRLTLNVGLRSERETIPSFRRDIKQYAFKFGFQDKLAPRLGASFDVLGNGKLKVSGFWGRFFDWTKMDLSRGTFGGDVWRINYRTLDTLDVYSLNLNNMPGTNLWQACCGGSYRDYRLPGFQYVDPNIKPMSTEMINVGTEWEVRPQTVFSARFVRNNLRRTIEDMGSFDAQENVVYRYGNPGEGTNKFTPATGASCPDTLNGVCAVPIPPVKRVYDALELQLNRQFSKRWFGNVSYVYSRLYGNYPGLASTDEYRPDTLGYGYATDQTFGGTGTRPGGNANLAYDLDQYMYDAQGHPGPYGLLPTDRPRVLKLYGAYNFKFGTQVGTFFRAETGTPISTQVDSTDWYPMLVNGRGDLGRTPALTQTDLMVAHEIKFGESKRLRLEFNMQNLFNQKTSVYTFPWYNYDEIYDTVGLDMSNVDLSKGYNWRYMATEASNGNGIALDPRYKKPAVFNPGFQGRLLIKFIF